MSSLRPRPPKRKAPRPESSRDEVAFLIQKVIIHATAVKRIGLRLAQNKKAEGGR